MTLKELIGLEEALKQINPNLISVNETDNKIIISTKNLETAIILCGNINSALYDNYYLFNSPFNFSLDCSKDDFYNQFTITITA